MLRNLFGRSSKATEYDVRLENSLAKTRSGFLGKIGTIFQANEITDELWDELEEALILGDVGVPVTQDLVRRAVDLFGGDALHLL